MTIINWIISALTSNWIVEGWAQALLILAFIACFIACVRLLRSNTRYIEAEARVRRESLDKQEALADDVATLERQVKALSNTIFSRNETIASLRAASQEDARTIDSLRARLKPFERKKGKGGRFVGQGGR